METKRISIWRMKSWKEKKLTLAANIITGAIIVLAMMQIAGIWKNAIYVVQPLSGVLMTLYGLKNYKENKREAWSFFGFAIVIFLIAIIIFLIWLL